MIGYRRFVHRYKGKEKFMKKSDNLPLKLLVGIIVGIIAGLFLPASAMTVVVTLKYVLNQVLLSRKKLGKMDQEC